MQTELWGLGRIASGAGLTLVWLRLRSVEDLVPCERLSGACGFSANGIPRAETDGRTYPPNP